MAPATTQPAPTCRPGERLIAGRVTVFNADLLNDHLAREAIAGAPADLSALTGEQLTKLKYAGLRILNDAASDALLTRVLAEQARRVEANLRHQRAA